jgi:methylenetetrahydrofolate--tRNA-(uracil-5-)-methyltransferase
MNVNFGIMPPLETKKIDGRKIKRKDRKPLKSERALNDLHKWLESIDHSTIK